MVSFGLPGIRRPGDGKRYAAFKSSRVSPVNAGLPARRSQLTDYAEAQLFGRHRSLRRSIAQLKLGDQLTDFGDSPVFHQIAAGSKMS